VLVNELLGAAAGGESAAHHLAEGLAWCVVGGAGPTTWRREGGRERREQIGEKRREGRRGRAEGVATHHGDEWRVAQRRRLVECHLWQGRFRERSGKG